MTIWNLYCDAVGADTALKRRLLAGWVLIFGVPGFLVWLYLIWATF